MQNNSIMSENQLENNWTVANRDVGHIQYIKTLQLGAFMVYFVYLTAQSEMQDICKLSKESDAEKEKCQSGRRWKKDIFFPLGFLKIWFCQSEIKS